MNKSKKLTILTAIIIGLTSFSTIPMKTIAEDGAPAVVSASEEIAVKEKGEIIFDADNLSVKAYTGDELNLNNVQLRFGIYHDGLISYVSPLYDFQKFSVGSGINSEFYTIDTSQVNTTKAGQYYIVLKSKEGAVFKALSDYNTNYEITLAGTESYLPVIVYDKESIKETPIYLRFFTENIEASAGSIPDFKLCGAMASDVRYEVEDETIARVTERSNSELLELECLKEGETTINVYTSDGRKTSEKIIVTPSLYQSVDPDNLPSTTTTKYNPNFTYTTTTIVTVDKWWYEYEKNLLPTTTTTDVRTSHDEKPLTTTTTLPFAKVDLDTSDMKVGETREGHCIDPRTGENIVATIMPSSNMNVSYSSDQKTFTLTAIKEGLTHLAIVTGDMPTYSIDINVVALDATVTDIDEPEIWIRGTGVDHFDSIKTLPTKTIYDEGEKLDLSGLVVNAYHSATRSSNKGKSETLRTDYVWEIEEIKPDYITISDLQGKSYKFDQFAELKGGNAYVVSIGKNQYIPDIKIAGEEYEKDLYDTEGFSFRVYINSEDKNSKFIKINNAEVENFAYGTTSKGFKLKGSDAFSIDMDANMHVGYFIESDIRQGDKVSGVLYIKPETNYIIMGDLNIIEYGGEDGDANADGTLDMADAVLIMQTLANPNKYGLNGTSTNHITKRGTNLGDMDYNGLTVGDAEAIQRKLLGLDVDAVFTIYSEKA